MGEGRSEPASLELVVWLEELRDSTLQDDISNDRGLEVFIRTLLSNVDTLKRRALFYRVLSMNFFCWKVVCNINATYLILRNFNTIWIEVCSKKMQCKWNRLQTNREFESF